LRFADAAPKIKFRFFSGYSNAILPTKENSTLAETQNEIWNKMNGLQEVWKINISTELVQPLLRTDLTDAER
jgi:hypothetical protein